MTRRTAAPVVKKKVPELKRKIIDLSGWKGRPVEEVAQVYCTPGRTPDILEAIGTKHKSIRGALRKMNW